MMKKYILFPHGGSGNHGCEAIVRTTTEMLKDKSVLLFSTGIGEDQKYIGDALPRTLSPQAEIKRTSLRYLEAVVKAKLLHQADSYDAAAFSPVISQCDKDTVLLLSLIHI